MRRFLVVSAVAGAMLGGTVPGALAQDATPAASSMASPVAGPCVAPDLPPGTPTPMEATPAATPMSDEMAGMAATPEAVEVAEEIAATAEAGPEQATVIAGTPADPALAEAALAAAQNFANCLTSGTPAQIVALISDDARAYFFGTTNAYDVIAAMEAEPVPPIGLRSLGNPQQFADGRVGVEAVYTGFLAFGPNQVNTDRWYFVERGGAWLWDGYEALPYAGTGTTIEGRLVDYAFELSASSAPAGTVAFNVVNGGAYPHEIIVVQLPAGVTVDQVLEDPSLQEQVAFFGGNFAEPGGNASFALEGMEPGTYTLLCFVEEPEGVPHVVRGMVAEFVVE